MLGVAFFPKLGGRVYLGVGSLDSWTRGIFFLQKVLPMVVLLSNKGSIFEKDTNNS